MVKLAPCIAALIFSSVPGIALLQSSPVVAQSASQTNVSVANIARQVTVQIEGQNPGSGVIIGRQGHERRPCSESSGAVDWHSWGK
jgi:hypothetical protein